VKRLVLALASLAVMLSACAVGDPKLPTYVSDAGAVLNGNVHSDAGGSTEYWWRYGPTSAYGSETPHVSVATTNNSAHPVSAPIAGLSAATTYHWQLCVNDQAPERNICSKDQTFVTTAAGGSSGIAFVSTRGVSLLSDIFVMDTAGGGQTNLTNTLAAAEDFPAWSPDGKRIVYSRGNELWTMNADGSGQAALTATPTVIEQEPAWSPDGSKIAFHGLAGTDTEIFTINAADGGGQTQLTNNTFEDRSPAWSPNGDKLAFDSDRSGVSHIYLMSANGTNQVLFSFHPEAQSDPAWSVFRNAIGYTGQSTGYTYTAFDELAEGDTFGASDGLSDDGGNADDSRVSVSPSWGGDEGFAAIQRLPKLSTNSDIHKVEADQPTNLTNNAAPDTYPAWSPRP
jgi:dipeptidyl aminopeptidase/acylaminoacyl peptidase